MRNRRKGTFALTTIMAVLLLAGGFAFAEEQAPMTPEYAAKKENFRKQQEQRITNDQRKAAAEKLKAERVKVNKAKEEAARQAAPAAIETK
jgi:hypothetical protein